MLTQRQTFLLLFAVSMAVLLGAYGFQYIGGLPPCRLCLYQRAPYGLAMALAACGVAWPRHARLLFGLIALGFALNTLLGVHHAGVEWKWWAGPDSCSDIVGGAATLEAMMEKLMAAPVVRCDEAPWTLAGLSLAGYNALISFGLMWFAALNWKRAGEKIG